jgi:hypothetical protein
MNGIFKEDDRPQKAPSQRDEKVDAQSYKAK